MEYDYHSSSTPIELTPGKEMADLGSLAEYIHGSLRLLPGSDWELISHDIWTYAKQPVLTLIFRRPTEDY